MRRDFVEKKERRVEKDKTWRIASSSRNASILTCSNFQYPHRYFTGIATSLNIYAVKKSDQLLT